MIIHYNNDALESLSSLILFIEKTNTQGSGIRWLNKYEEFLFDRFRFHETIKPCNNVTLRDLNLKCLNYNEWIIAFSVEENEIIIEAFLHYSRIAD
jgi:hypothetical protein